MNQVRTIMTGATIYLNEYDAWARCDVWLIPGYEGLVFRINNEFMYKCDDVDDVHFTIEEVQVWFNRDASHGTMMVRSTGYRVHKCNADFYAKQGIV